MIPIADPLQGYGGTGWEARHALDGFILNGWPETSIHELTKFTSAPATNLEAAECAVDPNVASQQEGPDLEPAGQVRPFYVGFERVSFKVYFIVVFYLCI